MDRRFEEWLREFNSGLKQFKKGEVWGDVQSYNENEKDLLKWYIQYKSNLEDKDFQNNVIVDQTNILREQQNYNHMIAVASIILACVGLLQVKEIFGQFTEGVVIFLGIIIAVCFFYIFSFILLKLGLLG